VIDDDFALFLAALEDADDGTGDFALFVEACQQAAP
jgi:hypothetical protein